MMSWEVALVPLMDALRIPPWSSVSGTIGFAAANVLIVAAPAALARYWGLVDRRPGISVSISPLWIVALLAGVLPGSLAGTWARAYATGSAVVLADTWIWALAAVLSVATFAPAAFGILLGFSDPAPAPARAWEGWSVSAAILALFIWLPTADWQHSYAIVEAMLFALPLIWLALRFSRRSTCLAVAFVAGGVTLLSGNAALGHPRLVDPAAWRDTMMSVDVFMLTVCGGALLVNLITVNQRSLTANLAHEHQLLQATEDRLRSVVREMPVLMDAFDEHGNIVAWNRECERVTGYAASEIIANPCAMELLYPDAGYRDLMLEEAAHRRHEDYSSVWDLTAKDGSVRTIEWFNVGARLTLPGWREWSIGIDITERRRLENAVSKATFDEQRRLGRELHDGLGQELTGLSMLATALARSRALTDPALAADLSHLALVASKAIVSCKNLARGLAPITDPDEGLADALRALTDALAAQTRHVEVTYVSSCTAALMVPLETSNHLYRIAQEALNNALKHGAPNLVRVTLDINVERVRIEVSDDGCGMAEALAPDGGLGLRSMRDRATAIGAALTMAPSDSGGTMIRCECPNVGPPRHRR
jgi:PAS domain S-box-containing protein